VKAVFGLYASRLRAVVLLLAGSAVVWSLAAAWFSAHRIIGYGLEMDSYCLSCAIVICGSFVYAYLTPKPCAGVKSAVIIVTTICRLLLVVTSCGHSDGAFMNWKMRQVSSDEWQTMTADLKALGKEIPEFTALNTYSTVEASRLPKSFDNLGNHADFCFFYSGNEPCVIYGSHGAEGRHWGLMIGTEHFRDREHPEVVNRIRVGDNCYFFVDPN